ncbi:MAG: LysR family transcriptional regulator [Actinomycetota bacterium]|nr:LysR family transcriptional regulator [Actinomycetota bacterium]
MDLLSHLETFVAVADQRSFSRAAEKLGIAQPLLSRRVKNLEAALDGELFHRTSRQIRLSDFGALLLPYAQDVLDRTNHLRSVAESARSSTVRVLGIPPGCEPSALARVIRAAADRGIPLSVHEAPAAARAAALSDGVLALALVRVPADDAPLVVALGLASATPPSITGGFRSLHLDSLRPRRGVHVGEPPALLVVPEDDIPVFTDRLHRSMAAAGLAQQRVRTTSSSSAAAAEVLAGAGLLLCDGPFARRHGLSWTPLADGRLHRGYELVGAPRRDGASVAAQLADFLEPLLGAAVGAAGRGEPPGDDPRAHLMVRA